MNPKSLYTVNIATERCDFRVQTLSFCEGLPYMTIDRLLDRELG
jgi:hypothetical protein